MVDQIKICLVGAGNVLQKEDDTVCQANIESVTQLLEKKNIPVKAAVLGGTERKGVSLDVQSGSVFYTEGNGTEKLLWKTAEQSISKQ